MADLRNTLFMRNLEARRQAAMQGQQQTQAAMENARRMMQDQAQEEQTHRKLTMQEAEMQGRMAAMAGQQQPDTAGLEQRDTGAMTRGYLLEALRQRQAEQEAQRARELEFLKQQPSYMDLEKMDLARQQLEQERQPSYMDIERADLDRERLAASTAESERMAKLREAELEAKDRWEKERNRLRRMEMRQARKLAQDKMAQSGAAGTKKEVDKSWQHTKDLVGDAFRTWQTLADRNTGPGPYDKKTEAARKNYDAMRKIMVAEYARQNSLSRKDASKILEMREGVPVKIEDMERFQNVFEGSPGESAPMAPEMGASAQSSSYGPYASGYNLPPSQQQAAPLPSPSAAMAASNSGGGGAGFSKDNLRKKLDAVNWGS